MAESTERKSSQPTPTPESRSRVSDELRRTVIVVVEDDGDTRAALSIALEGSGMEVWTTGDGHEALLYLRKTKRQVVVLLDLYMPGLNGFELYQKLQTDPKLAPIPVIVVTAAPPQKRIGLNVAGTIRKPIDFDELLIVLEKVAEKTQGVALIAAGQHFLAGGGEMGARMREKDWSATPLGPVERWPQSLLSPLSMLLPSKAQIIFFWGPEFVVFYNDAYRSVFSAQHPKMLGMPGSVAWSEIWDSGVNLHGLLDGVVRTGEAFSAQDLLFVLERSGFVEETYFDVSYDPVRNESGAVGGVFCIVTETTGRVVGERRLALLKDLAARNATARTTREACVLALETIAAQPKDVLFALAYLDGELQAATPEAEAQLLQATPEVVTELPLGTGKLVLGINPQRPFDEQYRAFLELVAGQVATAVANARAYEDERRRAEALAEIDRAKTAFFTNVSHEFRTPLTLMLGPLDDLLAKPNGVLPQNRELLTTVLRNGQRLLKLVNTLLDFSRIEAGRAQASYEPIDLAALTADLASTFRAACERAGLSLDVDCPPLGDPAFVDRDMWEKVVLNLLSNAFKFTFEGTIAVTLRGTPEAFELKVRDTGTGVPTAELPRMFERFHRIAGARGRSHEGSGIGLALVQELVRLHGGWIEVESKPGAGTTFTVAIPKGSGHLPAGQVGTARGAAATAVRAAVFVDEALRWLPGTPEPEATRSPPASGQRILVADDNADLREYVQSLLGGQYDVETVGDGAAALAAARARKPDLVVSDVMMPALDGFGLIRAMRADPELRGVPVILLSARAGEESRLEGIGKGADDYLAKPFSARELLVRVGALLHAAEFRRQESEQERRAADLDAFRVALSDRLRGLADPVEIQDAASRLLGEHLGVTRVHYVEIEHDEFAVVHREYRAAGAVSLEGRHRLADFDPALIAELRAGRTFVTTDTQTDSRFEDRHRPHFVAINTRGFVTAPLIKSGRWAAALVANHAVPHYWTELEVSLVEEVAERTWAAVERATAAEALKEADRRKDEFLATLAHELRNPLAPLRNALQLLRRPGNHDSTNRPVHEMMERQVNHLVRLVDDLLELSRVSRGTFELRRERVELAAVVRNAIETSESLLKARQHQLSVVLPEEPVHFDGDPVRLAQILANLLNNAATYTPPGGAISVRASRQGAMGIVEVRDNGIGIAADQLPRLFEMFSRGHHADDAGHGGLGIGLALARQLAEMHGGTITARSQGPGQGSAFTVSLPLAAGVASPEPRTAQPAGPQLNRQRILVVDDNRDAAESLRIILDLAGADVTMATGGAEALAAFETTNPTVVVLDLGMPDMDGYEVARLIRSRFPDRHPAIIALSGWGQEKDRRRAREAGFDHHFIKPVDIDALQELLASIGEQTATLP